MNTQRILITGANGYLGAQLSTYFAQKGHSITALCFPEIPKDANWCASMNEVLVGSIAEDSTIERLAQYDFDAIIHLVSLDHHQSAIASTPDVLKVNVQPAWRLLETFAPKGLKTFLFFSTIHVYGALPVVRVSESYPTSPANVYALTHLLTEQVCDYFNRTSEVNCLTARLSNSYGEPVFPENNCWWLAVNDLCRMAYYDKCIRLLSDGSPQRDFIHGSDVCRAVDVLLTAAPKDVAHSTFHVSSSKTHSLLELAGMVQSVYLETYGERLVVSTPLQEAVSDFDRYAEVDTYTIDNTALRSLGFENLVDLKAGIRQLFSYFDSRAHA